MIIEPNILADSISNGSLDLSGLVAWEEQTRFLGIKLINTLDLTELILRFVFNSLIVLLELHKLYSRNSQRKDFYFSYLAISIIIFMMCFLLNNVKLELGFALGLFAIFGIIRYRTDAIPIKEMTYLFIVIGISVLNALSNKKVSYTELLFTNTAILAGLWLLEKIIELKHEGSVKFIYYNNYKIHADKEDILHRDLIYRKGIVIKR
mgnify:CR=1 FL=1